ncbi:unnamed protein product [Trifolium pratense]|uniref:Uncharacterized protein n=1 Tax=Trifolium pratense TaxID=57577 RepID=A0ACB0KQ30_TRIPR|nr:unnamed protein product [Trifolium pratense]
MFPIFLSLLHTVTIRVIIRLCGKHVGFLLCFTTGILQNFLEGCDSKYSNGWQICLWNWSDVSALCLQS